MNYFLLALALATALLALLYITNIVRVALGLIVWANNAAFLAHMIVAPVAAALSIWLFQTAVAR